MNPDVPFLSYQNAQPTKIIDSFLPTFINVQHQPHLRDNMKKLLAILLLLFCVHTTVLAQQAITTWLSDAVVPGEQTRLFIILPDGNIASQEPLPRVKGASLRWVKQGNYIRWANSPNQAAFLMAIEVTPDEVGTVEIPSLTLHSNNGRTYTTLPQTLTVYPYSAIKWNTLDLNGLNMSYGILWHVDNQKPYVHQPDSCELKIYAPEYILEYMAPSITTSNLATWRFEPTLVELLRGQPRGSVLYKGANWNVMTFQSTMFPLRAGEVTASGTVTALAVIPQADPLMANFIRSEVQVEMTIPEVKITAQELPEGAPESFTNAVGNFRIDASTDARDLSANEPISVKIRVTGTGNIHSIACPTLTDASNWKLYPPNKLDPDQSMRSIQGTVEFQQMMRPIAQTDSIPPFELTFFDPETQQYKTITTAPIPLEWKASAITGVAMSGNSTATEPPPAGTIPIAEMTDIYGLIPGTVISALTTPPHWGWYFLAYIPAVILLGTALLRYIRKIRQESFSAKERMRAFRGLTSSATAQESSTSFLRAVGNFIEAYIPQSARNEEMKTILQLRDDRAFQPEDTTDALPHTERQRILRSIKKVISKLPVLMMTVVLSLTLGTTGNATETDNNLGTKAYEQGEYAKAIDYFSKENDHTKLSKEERAYAYFGIGNSYYRLNKPGLAALNYRRALELSPYFTEAQCNLQFIERKEGAILPVNTEENRWLTYISHDALIPITILTGAVMITFLALLTITRKHRVLLITLATLSGLLTATAITNYIIYPATPESIPADSLLIVTNKTSGRHAADLASPVVINLPASTPLILRAERGSWYYATTFQHTPVWIPKEDAQNL